MGTYIQTYIHTEFFFIVVLGLWEASKLTKKILAQSEKITDRIHYGIICPEFFGHIKIKCLAPSFHTLILSLKINFLKNNIKLKDMAQEIQDNNFFLHSLVCQNLFYEGFRTICAKDNSAKKTEFLFYAISFAQIYCNLYHTSVITVQFNILTFA